jgi:hypothetical protein
VTTGRRHLRSLASGSYVGISEAVVPTSDTTTLNSVVSKAESLKSTSWLSTTETLCGCTVPAPNVVTSVREGSVQQKLPFVNYTCDSNHGEMAYQTYYANGETSNVVTVPSGFTRPRNCNSCVTGLVYNVALDPCILGNAGATSSSFTIRQAENHRCTLGCVIALTGSLGGVVGTLMVGLVTHFACFTEKFS